MRAIVTLQNADNSYDMVGMRNRTVIDDRFFHGIIYRAEEWAKGKPHKIEYYYSGNLLSRSDPDSVAYMCGATKENKL